VHREEDKVISKVREEGHQKAARSERNDGDEGFVEDYIEHDQADKEQRELRHSDKPSMSSYDDDEEVGARAAYPMITVSGMSITLHWGCA
jgi:hypothetical protein